jgi:hypothetical protein
MCLEKLFSRPKAQAWIILFEAKTRKIYEWKPCWGLQKQFWGHIFAGLIDILLLSISFCCNFGMFLLNFLTQRFKAENQKSAQKISNVSNRGVECTPNKHLGGKKFYCKNCWFNFSFAILPLLLWSIVVAAPEILSTKASVWIPTAKGAVQSEKIRHGVCDNLIKTAIRDGLEDNLLAKSRG